MTASGLVMPTRILVVGGGAREHALAWKLSVEPGVNEVTVAPGSYAIGAEPRVRALKDVDPLDADRVVFVAKAIAAELVVVGPEAPLAAGVADALHKHRIAVFGPTAAAARIESSKAFCHDVALAAGVPMAEIVGLRDRRARSGGRVRTAARGRGQGHRRQGRWAGGGQGRHRLRRHRRGGRGDRRVVSTAGAILIEERLEGREASLIALCDGREALALPFARDHKRLGDLDEGPNTGGMGAYSPLEDLPDDAADELVERFHRPILAELARRGTPFRGALYAGLMLTAGGPVLLECNARFGDPETQVILPRLAAPLGPLLLAAAKGRLKAAMKALGVDGHRAPVHPRRVARSRAGGGWLSRRAAVRRSDRGAARCARLRGTPVPCRHGTRCRRRLSNRWRSRPDGRRPRPGPRFGA